MKHIHFIGIKGVGMSALAIFAKDKGYQVSGSDVEDSFVTDNILKKAQINVTIFAPENLKDRPDLVITSAAYSKDNPEIKEAKKRHLEIKPYSEALEIFARDSQIIAVAGIHGKTTTAALISFLLIKANLDPSFVIGSGNIPSLGGNAHYGKGDYIVLEADEYRKSSEDSTSKFLDLTPKVEVITSIEMDHPDIFASEESVYNVFYKFACRIPRNGFIVLCLDYPKAKKLYRSLVDRNFETYGFEEGAAWQIIEFAENENLTSFWLSCKGERFGPFKLKIPGVANVLNATAAIIIGLKLGIEEKLIKKYLPEFSGVKRRFEKIGQIDEITIIDDYAHHPRSIALTLEAARKKFPHKKIWCIFQPHTYSRTKALLKDFARSFKNSDKTIITEIYASAREENASISGQDLAQAIKNYQRSVKFIPDKEKIIQEIVDSAEGPILLITMGAGDIYQLAGQILEKLKNGKS